MIGLGVWKVTVNSMFYKGTAEITVRDVDGEYDFSFKVPDFNIPEMDISNVTTDGNTLSADATCDMLKGQTVHIDVEFNDDTCKGVLKAPMGIKLKMDGVKIG